MPLFKSLRSKSRKSSFSSEAGLNSNGTKAGAGLFGRGEDDAASMIAGSTTSTSPIRDRMPSSMARVPVGSPIREDPPGVTAAGRSSLGPTSPSLSVSGGDRKRGGFFARSNSRRDLTASPPQRTLSYGQTMEGNGSIGLSAAPAPVASPQHETAPALSVASNAQAEATAEAANQPPGGARPSDLFAGKGVAWGDLNLSPGGGTAPKAPQQTEDLSNFLKARRQWVPTFAIGEGDKDEFNVKPISKPADIAFSALPAASNLMNLSDLDASHRRKQHLLGADFESTTLLSASKNSSTGITSAVNVSRTTAVPLPAPAATGSPSRSAAMNSTLATPTVNAGRSSPARKPVPSPTAASFTENAGNNEAAILPNSAAKLIGAKDGVPGSGGEDKKTAVLSPTETSLRVPAETASLLPQDVSSLRIHDPVGKEEEEAGNVEESHQRSISEKVLRQEAPLQESSEAVDVPAASASVPVSELGSGGSPDGASAYTGTNGGAAPALDLNNGYGFASAYPKQQHSLQSRRQSETPIANEQESSDVAESAIPVHPSYNKTESTASVPQMPGGMR